MLINLGTQDCQGLKVLLESTAPQGARGLRGHRENKDRLDYL